MNIRNLGILVSAALFLAASSTAAPNIVVGSADADILRDQGGVGFVPLFAVLLGGNEVSNEGEANVGDLDGRGSATVIVNPDSGALCFASLVIGIDTPVAAHIHQALAGQNGPIVVTLTAPDAGNLGASSGCLTDLEPTLLEAIRRGPEDFYVNVHTEELPDGALRGQLF
ncbi:MAG: CHRD domain-containing protein [Gammaproteobacteria bacterium]